MTCLLAARHAHEMQVEGARERSAGASDKGLLLVH